jgi:thiol:disulfide interchange protein DsbD
MNRVKVVMGLIEMAFMFKFLSVADVAWNSTPTILDYHLVMSAWMAISVVAGLYLIGKIQLPHDTKEDHIGVIPMVVAMCFFGLASYLGVGIFGHEPPGGFFGQQIVAFAPPRFQGGIGEDGPFLIDKHDQQKYLLDFELAKAKAKRDGVPLFVDFTGVNCINCRKMEAMMGGSSTIQGELQKMVRVRLYTDTMPKEAVGDAKQSEELLNHNGDLQVKWFGEATLPGYAVASSDGRVIFSKVKGLVPEADFATFLKCGLSKKQSKKTTEVASVQQP